MPSINSARYAQRIIQTESHESPSFLRKVHRLDPPGCAPVWSRSPHVKKVDIAINSSLRTISGCLKPTPVFQLPDCWSKAESSHPRLGTESSETRLARPARHGKNEVPPCRLKSVKTLQQGGSGDAKCHP